MIRGVAAAGCLAAVASTATGCSSTRDQAARFARSGNEAFRAKGLTVGRSSSAVRVVSRTVLTDANGTAAVLGLRNTTAQALVDVPVSVVVSDRAGRPVYRNDAPGLERGLVSAPLLAPSQTVEWVDDQVQPTGAGTPAAVTAKIGAAGRAGPGSATPLDVGTPTLSGDPTSGLEATGMLTNTTTLRQTSVIVSAVAIKGGQVVAAGRAIVPRLAPGRKARYSVFFIGDPRGARLRIVAPPTVLR